MSILLGFQKYLSSLGEAEGFEVGADELAWGKNLTRLNKGFYFFLKKVLFIKGKNDFYFRQESRGENGSIFSIDDCFAVFDFFKGG